MLRSIAPGGIDHLRLGILFTRPGDSPGVHPVGRGQTQDRHLRHRCLASRIAEGSHCPAKTRVRQEIQGVAEPASRSGRMSHLPGDLGSARGVRTGCTFSPPEQGRQRLTSVLRPRCKLSPSRAPIDTVPEVDRRAMPPVGQPGPSRVAATGAMVASTPSARFARIPASDGCIPLGGGLAGALRELDAFAEGAIPEPSRRNPSRPQPDRVRPAASGRGEAGAVPVVPAGGGYAAA